VRSTRPDRERHDGGDGGDGEVLHLICCDDAELALCGTDVRDEPWDESRSADCVVCVDMHRTKSCPQRGRCPLTLRWRSWVGLERGRPDRGSDR
jgi:hypothetical protein